MESFQESYEISSSGDSDDGDYGHGGDDGNRFTADDLGNSDSLSADHTSGRHSSASFLDTSNSSSSNFSIETTSFILEGSSRERGKSCFDQL